jgi:phosphoglycerol transferase MdoB-like AlkP superfamily enzyme
MKKIYFAFSYWLTWILLFQLARLIFSFYHYKESLNTGLTEMLKSFLYGLRMDMSMASYFTVLFCFILLLHPIIGEKTTKLLLKIYSIALLIPASIIILCDMPAYAAWGYRLDATPLKYLLSPREAVASTANLPLFGLIATWLIAVFLISKIKMAFIESRSRTIMYDKRDLKNTLFLLLFTAVQIIPIRGGFQLAPMNQSAVYFSNQQHANLSAINVCWNFMHSLSHDLNADTNPFECIDKSTARNIIDSLMMPASDTITAIHRITSAQPNVILIVWESFTGKVVDSYKNGIEITPAFNRLKKEGLYFSDIYATGDRTDKGIVGVLSGYPAQPTTSIVKVPQKADKLPKLPALFSEKSYNTSFYYGGELEFANMKTYLMGSGFQRFVSKSDFESKDQNSKWGAHDGVVMNKLSRELAKEKSPFFSTWLTLSSHEPYETPEQTAIKGKDDESLFLNSLHYTDNVIGNFIQQCKQQPFWQNTLVVIIADHGHRLPYSKEKINDFRIPMLWLGGALQAKSQIINSTGSQIDLAKTILNQLEINSSSFVWSKDLLAEKRNPWAYFSFNNGFGWVKDKKNYFVYDNVGNRIMEEQGSIDSNDIKAGKAMQQNSFADYLSK